MDKKNTYATIDFFLVFIDMAAAAIAYFVSVCAYSIFLGREFSITQYIWMLIVFNIVFVLVMMFLQMYDMTTFTYTDRIIIRTVGTVIFTGIIIASLVFMLQLKETSRFFFLLFCALSAVFIILCRMVLVKQKFFYGKKTKKAFFIGEKGVYERYLHYLSKTSLHYDFSGIFEYGDNQINTSEKFEGYIVKHAIQEVIIVYSQNTQFDYGHYVYVCEEMGITVRLVLDMIQIPTASNFTYSIGKYSVLTYHNVPMNRFQLCLKSVFDFIASFIGVILLSPLMLGVAVAIKIDSPGPVFFRQKRVGCSGAEFDIIKFRSMSADAEKYRSQLESKNKIKDGMMFKIDEDPRITKVGKFIRKYSIDELPQLFNVLMGDMSLVGTRPPTVNEVEKYQRHHRRRISIRPGITGIWQVSGRSDITDFETVVAMDTQYIDQWSLLLDLKLILKTVKIVFTRKGAY